MQVKWIRFSIMSYLLTKEHNDIENIIYKILCIFSAFHVPTIPRWTSSAWHEDGDSRVQWSKYFLLIISYGVDFKKCLHILDEYEDIAVSLLFNSQSWLGCEWEFTLGWMSLAREMWYLVHWMFARANFTSHRYKGWL